MKSRHQPSPGPAPGIYGIPLEDPRQDDEPLALYIDRIASAVMALIRQYHHRAEDRGFEVEQCHIGPPRGKHAGIARIELQYRREGHGYRHVFAVTDSKEHGLRLWTEVRRYVRQS
ncbi:MAG: hypothetical protein ACEQSB_02700 [Undibacterium sp.]